MKRVTFCLLCLALLLCVAACKRKLYPYGGDKPFTDSPDPEYSFEVDVNKPAAQK